MENKMIEFHIDLDYPTIYVTTICHVINHEIRANKKSYGIAPLTLAPGYEYRMNMWWSKMMIVKEIK